MAPHFGLMDAGRMGRAVAARQRARLHWRSGRRRLAQGKTALAVVTLYDALLSGLRWHFLANPGAAAAGYPAADLEHDRVLFALAAQAGLLDAGRELPPLQALFEKALRNEELGPGQGWFVERVGELLTRISILPFAEESLPPEDPDTD